MKSESGESASAAILDLIEKIKVCLFKLFLKSERNYEQEKGKGHFLEVASWQQFDISTTILFNYFHSR